MTRTVALLLTALVLLAAPAPAQNLRGEWVDQADRAIDQLRKVDLKIIVMDESGKPVPGAVVRVVQRQHAFAFGVELDRRDFAEGSPLPAQTWRDLPVWRGFSAVSLDQAGGWTQVQPAAGQWDFSVIDRMISWAEAGGLQVRWGSLTSADVGRMPPWAALLPASALRDAVDAHVRQVVARYGRRVEQFDVHTECTRRQDLVQRLGPAIERRLYELVQAGGEAQTAARFEDALLGEPTQRMIRRITAMREQFIPVQVMAAEARLTGTMVQAPLARSLEWMSAMQMPIVVVNLQLQAGSEATAALNLETALRTLFAHPRVQGVWFAPITAAHTGDATSALIDEHGRPTDAGKTFDKLVHGLWRTEQSAPADEMGSATLRVFAGRYELSTTLSDVQARTEVYLAPGEPLRLVALQPLSGPAAER